MSLSNKVVLVTGGSGLIGQAILDVLVKKGAVVVNADLQPSKMQKETTFVKCDITDNESVVGLIEMVCSKYGKIDGFVNNAYPRTSDWGVQFEDIKYNSWTKNVDMQLNSSFFILKAVLEKMKIQNSGSIVNIASIYGIVGNDFTVYDGTDGMTSPAAYSAIKGALINFTKYLASYFGPYSIRVNCVSPGGVFNNQHENFVENYSRKVPMRRMALAEEIAPAIAFLLSNEASYITGHNLVVDGGWTAI